MAEVEGFEITYPSSLIRLLLTLCRPCFVHQKPPKKPPKVPRQPRTPGHCVTEGPGVEAGDMKTPTLRERASLQVSTVRA